MMPAAARSSATQDAIRRLGAGDHLCCIYRDRSEQMPIVVPYLIRGLENHEKCLYILDESTREDVLQAFGEAGVDLKTHVASGQCALLTKEETYLTGGSFDPERMIATLEQAEADAIREGYTGLRVTGEMTWVSARLPGVEKLIEYEAKLNLFFPNSRSSALCQYHEDRFEPDVLIDVLHTHPAVVIYGEVCANPYYIPTEEFLLRMKSGRIPLALYQRVRDDFIARARLEANRQRLEGGQKAELEKFERSRRALLSALEDQTQAQIARDRLLREQVALNRITLSLGALTELPAVLRTLYDEVRTLLDADGFFASRYHKDTQLITALFAIDEGGELDVSTFPPVPLAPEGHGMQSQVLRTGKPLNVPDWLEGERKMQTVHHLAPDGTFTPPPPDTERDDCTKSALLVPLLFRGEPIGVLQVQSNRLNAYSDEDVDLLAGLGNVAAISIQNALLIEEAGYAADELRLSLAGTLHAVSAAAETRDPYTAGHQRRVTAIALAIARELGCSDDECNALRIAGTVHDIGKLGIPAEILSKPGPLSAIELDLIREHPQTAYKILADVPFPGPVAEIVLQHHERLDGSGYPRGLTGEQTLREARILAVADVVEAMASHRPYRAARGIDAALGEIEQGAGRLYDSEAVEACLHLFRDKGFALPA
jgi:HD-GYP domain-containing protein (c-di-GMP phosphodiesterase class II)